MLLPIVRNLKLSKIILNISAEYNSIIIVIEFSGLPIALFHRYTLYGKSPILQHLFFSISGILICYWNYGN